MKKYLSKKNLMDYLRIIVGTFILSLAINIFFEKQHLVTGGVTGIAIIIKELTKNIIPNGIPLGVTNLVINIPLFIIGMILKGKNFAGKTLFSTLFLSFALGITTNIPMITENMLLSSLFGGALAGVGLGLVFSAFATTGGTDLAATIIQHFFKHAPLAKILFVLDGSIILAGSYVFGIENAMYAIISIYITTKIIDNTLEGVHFSKAAFIISDAYEEISSVLLRELDRGVTGLNGSGMFTKADRKVLLCVVSKKEIVKLKNIVKKIDNSAFIIVADVREVLGEGFIEYHQ